MPLNHVESSIDNFNKKSIPCISTIDKALIGLCLRENSEGISDSVKNCSQYYEIESFKQCREIFESMKTCNEIRVEDDWLANVSAHTDRPFDVENIDPTKAVCLISNIQDHSDLHIVANSQLHLKQFKKASW